MPAVSVEERGLPPFDQMVTRNDASRHLIPEHVVRDGRSPQFFPWEISRICSDQYLHQRRIYHSYVKVRNPYETSPLSVS